MHRDYQGSILAITNEVGSIVEKRQFDACGSLLSIQNGSSQPIANGQWLLDRGYTGHEHLQSVGLIHMNGRLYDPKLHRFLQPDNFVQDPSNTQNYNRYSYVLNNPLKYTDYSGEKWKIGWKDVVGGLQVVVGAVLLFVPGAQLIGGGLLLNGLSYFASTYEQYKVTGDWASASANSSIMFGYQTKTDWGYDSKSDKNGIAQNEPVVKPIAADDVRNMSSGGGYIHMPTQHTFLGINMTALSEGNFFQQVIYGAANSFNIPVQFLMGRGVGDGSMRNLDGTSTSTDEGVMAFGTLPLWLVGGGEVGGVASEATGGLKQWIRTGPSYSIEGGFKTFSTRWGAGGNYWKKIENPTLQTLNKSLRKTKLPGNNWRVNDPGHFHWWKK